MGKLNAKPFKDLDMLTDAGFLLFPSSAAPPPTSYFFDLSQMIKYEVLILRLL